jgi:hypothetical protein
MGYQRARYVRAVLVIFLYADCFYLDKGLQTRSRARPKVMSGCRTLIQGGLGAFFLNLNRGQLHSHTKDTVLQQNKLTKRSVTMNYDNYEGKIVERYGVELKGWPIGQIRNPSKVNTRTDLDQLAHTLAVGTCKWVLLTEDELIARKENNHAHAAKGAPVYKPRKSKKTAGNGHRSQGGVSDGNGEDD